MTHARDLIHRLQLQPHPEGGWYRELHRSPATVQAERGARSALTTIFYLLERGQVSRWHVVSSDEIWHFYAGAPLQLLSYDPATRVLSTHVLQQPDAGGDPVAVIAANVWQAARTLGDYSLVGCSVGPGFEFEDFRFVKTLPGYEEHFKDALRAHEDLL